MRGDLRVERGQILDGEVVHVRDADGNEIWRSVLDRFDARSAPAAARRPSGAAMR